MNIVQLTSESIAELRSKRAEIVKDMIEGQEGSLLVIQTTYAGTNRLHNAVSYAIFTIFFELWERFNMESWSYTFDKEGLIFYIKLQESGKEVKDILIHYEDHHPLGFAFDSEVYTKDGEFNRSNLGYEPRIDKFTQEPMLDVIKSSIDDKKYMDQFIKEIEGYIVKGDKQTILSNILLYGYISAFTKEYGFGMYGPNFKGSNEQMNFEKFVHLIRTYSQEIKKITTIPTTSYQDIKNFQNNTEKKIHHAVLNQQSYTYTIFMTSIVLFAFINSRGYADITNRIKFFSDNLKEDKRLESEINRYDVVNNGMREVFNYYVPFLQKNKSIISTLLYIMSRHDDQSIIHNNGEQNLLKVQFLAKNLINKPNKWDQMDKFCVSSYIYPHDDTTLLAITAMLDIMQRYYLKIKMLFDTNN